MYIYIYIYRRVKYIYIYQSHSFRNKKKKEASSLLHQVGIEQVKKRASSPSSSQSSFRESGRRSMRDGPILSYPPPVIHKSDIWHHSRRLSWRGFIIWRHDFRFKAGGRKLHLTRNANNTRRRPGLRKHAHKHIWLYTNKFKWICTTRRKAKIPS